MIRLAGAQLLLFITTPLFAIEWQFSEKIQVTQEVGDRIFHHLDAPGRKHIAVSNDLIAIVWEDNHTGKPQAYLAYKQKNEKVFSGPVQLSTAETAFAPAVTALDNGVFVVGWEQDNALYYRIYEQGRLSPPILISKQARQLALARHSSHSIIATWVHQDQKRASHILSAMITLDPKVKLTWVSKPVTLDTASAGSQLLYPTITRSTSGIVVVWENRERGHTILQRSFSNDGRTFSRPMQLNESVVKSTKYGRGSGVTRAAACTYSKDSQVAVVWMDKRGSRTGYDIYGAISRDGGRTFEKNEIVQDDFGNDKTQWNPAIAGNQHGDLVAAWDDDREDSSDVWFSYRNEDGWSEDMAISPASGEKHQVGPAIVFDSNRNLHVIWLEQSADFSPTRLYYAMGTMR